jgi:hypothetical protein
VSCRSIDSDANASSAFLAFYFEDTCVQRDQFETSSFSGTLEYGTTQVSLQGGIVLPSARVFHGALQVHNSNPFRVEYQLFGDPS